ncbi:hypothetical protein HK101_008731, partial [Irineochytrium annulatum]
MPYDESESLLAHVANAANAAAAAAVFNSHPVPQSSGASDLDLDAELGIWTGAVDTNTAASRSQNGDNSATTTVASSSIEVPAPATGGGGGPIRSAPRARRPKTKPQPAAEAVVTTGTGSTLADAYLDGAADTPIVDTPGTVATKQADQQQHRDELFHQRQTAHHTQLLDLEQQRQLYDQYLLHQNAGQQAHLEALEAGYAAAAATEGQLLLGVPAPRAPPSPPRGTIGGLVGVPSFYADDMAAAEERQA